MSTLFRQQAQILAEMKALQKKLKMAILLITHDLGIVADVADKIIVMYAGKIVEKGTVREIFYHPVHPYTKALLNSVPRLDRDGKEMCRKCIYDVWESEGPWRRTPSDEVFPIYEDGKDYTLMTATERSTKSTQEIF